MSKETLTVCSWNVLDTNARKEEVLKFLGSMSCDVFCLQEVSESLLEQLKVLPYKIVFGVDLIRQKKEETQTCYTVILTPHSIKSSNNILLYQNDPPKFRTATFIRLANLFGGAWTKLVGDRAGVCADIILSNSNQFRIFSAHLSNIGPKQRLKEFNILADHLLEDGSNIIAGDFNVIDNPKLNFYNWLMGAPFSESLPWYHEREIMEDSFFDAGFSNPMRGKSTILFIKNQTDHILVPSRFTVLNTKILKDSFGSDHYPLIAEVSINE